MLQLKDLSLFALAALAMLLSGCASMSGEGSYQTTLIRTNPPGASIFVDGRRVGQTPEFVDVRRSHRPVIQIDTEKGREDFELPTKYRWSQSFARNLIFLIYAPVGWVIDLATGTAWDIRAATTIPVRLSKNDLSHPKVERQPPEIAIAPPRSSSIVMSDTAGRALEERLLETYSGSSRRVRPYDQTLGTFLESGYEYRTMSEGARQRLLRDLKADYIVESTAVPNEDRSWNIQSEIREVTSGAVTAGPTLKLNREENEHAWLSRLMPNTLAVDFANESMHIQVAGASYALVPVNGEEWWAAGIRYFGAINVLSLPDRRREFGSRWELGAVPSLRFSRRLLKVSGLVANGSDFIEKDPQFARSSVSGGYGLEAGYLFGRHYLYMDFIPVFNWSEISWRQNMTDKTATRTSLSAQIEFGYTCVFDSNWFFRLFTKSQADNLEIWKDALTARLGDGYAPSETTGVISGLSIGYRFDFDRYRAVAARERKGD
jgi:hypothetical protein